MSQDNIELSFTPTKVYTTSLVSYESRGHCLVIASLDAGLSVIEKLQCKAATLLVHRADAIAPVKKATENGVKVITANVLAITGYLGTYDVAIGSEESPGSVAKVAGVSLLGGFDTVLDLSAQPLLTHEVLPFGYYSPGDNPESMQTALADIAELEGEFEKPKYFNYDSAVCAHSRSGITACTNCIDVCGTGAIRADGEGISVEPYLCQGCGSCASSCPSGAITYAYPNPADALSQLSALLADHKSKTGCPAVVYLHDSEQGAARLAEFSADLHAAILPVAVEEVASIGMDGWLCALAYGAVAVVAEAPGENSSMLQALSDQMGTANDILAGIGLTGRIHLLEQPDAAKLNVLADAQEETGFPVATFKTFSNKRQSIRLALDHLRQSSTTVAESVPLSNAAPFGQVLVNQSACTLCLACVTVCPARALQDGETLPQLKFIESSCLQCGMCEKACPEDAISLEARYLYDSERALQPSILNEEKPFNCIVCNKPFATERVIGRMLTKLAGHWMFEDDKSKRRLKMCEDCRVMDIFDSEEGIDVHKS